MTSLVCVSCKKYGKCPPVIVSINEGDKCFNLDVDTDISDDEVKSRRQDVIALFYRKERESSQKLLYEASNVLLTEGELDPTGKNAHEVGAKLDAGKPRHALVFGGFANALDLVSRVGTFGANKYTDNGWKSVENAEDRYLSALYRHLLAHQRGEAVDGDSGLPHLAHAAWNALAILELQK